MPNDNVHGHLDSIGHFSTQRCALEYVKWHSCFLVLWQDICIILIFIIQLINYNFNRRTGRSSCGCTDLTKCLSNGCTDLKYYSSMRLGWRIVFRYRWKTAPDINMCKAFTTISRQIAAESTCLTRRWIASNDLLPLLVSWFPVSCGLQPLQMHYSVCLQLVFQVHLPTDCN